MKKLLFCITVITLIFANMHHTYAEELFPCDSLWSHQANIENKATVSYFVDDSGWLVKEKRYPDFTCISNKSFELQEEESTASVRVIHKIPSESTIWYFAQTPKKFQNKITSADVKNLIKGDSIIIELEGETRDNPVFKKNPAKFFLLWHLYGFSHVDEHKIFLQEGKIISTDPVIRETIEKKEMRIGISLLASFIAIAFSFVFYAGAAGISGSITRKVFYFFLGWSGFPLLMTGFIIFIDQEKVVLKEVLIGWGYFVAPFTLVYTLLCFLYSWLVSKK